MSDVEPRLYGGRFELHRRLARGGMADVYLARDTLLDRPVAVKVLFPEFATDPSFVERFRREAQSAANLNHPNIVAIYDWGEEDGTYFIVMEYVEGRSLAQILKEQGPLQPDRAADVTIDIATALAFAHRNGVVHRDVKPGNVLVTPLGQVKVADFGIARAVSAGENLTQAGTVMGTATYFSPEQARGESVDPRSDVYSLGVVLYELLAGQPPFTGDSPISVAYKHVSEAPVPLRRRTPQVPEPLEAVTMRSLAKNPANRYRSADDMAEDLRRFRSGRPVQAESVLPDEVTMAGIAARPDATQAVAVADGTRVQPRVASQATTIEPPRRSPVFLVILVLLLGGVAALVGVLATNLDLGGDETVEVVSVPNVLNNQEADAIRRLENSGLEVKVVREANAAPQGTVFAQEPVGGTDVDEGTEVVITVATPRGNVAVPDVVGRTREDADNVLRDASLVADFAFEESEVVEQGRVIRQSPAPRTSIAPDSEVEVILSSGIGNATVPDVANRSAAEAANLLGRAGFNTTTQSQPSTAVPSGQVISTSPAAGASVPKNTTITINISSGAPTATVPDVRGRTAAEAQQALTAAGFASTRIENQPSATVPSGRVISTAPPNGSVVPVSQQITINVSSGPGGVTTTTTTTTTTTIGGG